ncbi:MAG TPA: Gfo/Idh/MocA family oxidoreductase [Gaiellaceae bacterium]|nr:Gfo/Idh/MocA family oxidoreductase [Gaiellaceae bacterium]
MDASMGGRSSQAPVRVAVVGLGYWGPNLVRNFSESPIFEVAHLCDVRTEPLDAVAARYPGIKCTTRFEDVLHDGDVDAVAIATPVSTHHALALSGLAAGKHVFVEKPLAGSSAQAIELMQEAEARNLVLMPGHTFVYSPAVRTIKGLIDAGELGDIYFVSSSRVNLGLHQTDVNVVWDLGPHDFSILRYWLRELPEEVSAMSRSCVIPGQPDVCFINLRYASGTVAHVEISWLSPSKLRRTTIVGSKRMVVYDDTSSEPVRIFDAGASIPDPQTFGEYQLTYRTGDIVSPRVEAVEPLSLEVADFGSAILARTSPASSPEMGLDVVRTVEAVVESLEQGGIPVHVRDASADGQLDEALRERVDQRVAQDGFEDEAIEPQSEADARVGTAILGGGPAGLTAAYVLGLRGEPGAVFEADGTVGGIAKTVEFNGYRFDLGGHRFFTKLQPIAALWEEMLGDDFLTRPRMSRIFYKGKFFAYPIRAKDVVGRLGVVEATRCALSYLLSARNRNADAETFEEWVTTRFGRRLYEAFFRSYTEKVWGIPGSEIRSLWAAQRIKNFSLGKAILSMLGLRREHVTTLIEEFRYPRLGPGQMWEAFAARAREHGIEVHLNNRCVSVKHADDRVERIVLRQNGDLFERRVDSVISTIALQDLILGLDPPPPPDVLAAARRLRYRDLVLVALMTSEREPFPDNWIYLHDPDTRAGRVQNFGAWSPDMVKPEATCLGVEYFCFRGDDIWEMPDEQAVELAKTELSRIGLIDPDQVVDGVKVLVPKAYPMYDSNYEEALGVIRNYLERFENLQTCGRNGLHRYNNQDHSMWSAILSVLNLVDGRQHDVWSINTEAAYLEEVYVVEAVLDASAGDVTLVTPTNVSAARSA